MQITFEDANNSSILCCSNNNFHSSYFIVAFAHPNLHHLNEETISL